MQLEDYFVFEKLETKFGPAQEIWIKGHRIILDFIITEYKKGLSPEKIVSDVYPTLELESVYAAILYYLHNKEAVEAHIELGKKICEDHYQDYLEHGPFWLKEKADRIRAAAAHEQTSIPGG